LLAGKLAMQNCSKLGKPLQGRSRAKPDSIVVLLWWEDEQQLIDIAREEELRASRRSDQREDGGELGLQELDGNLPWPSKKRRR
jgi:hypothetical protein